MYVYLPSLKSLTFTVALSLLTVNLFAQQADSTVATQRVVTGVKVSGTIRDVRTGDPLPGVSVSIPGFSAALTDDSGNFTLTVPDYSATLLVAGEGRQGKAVALKGRSQLTLDLGEDAMASVYDLAYLPGGQKPLNETVNSVVSINLNDKWQQPTESVDTYLQGKVAGLNVSRRSGTPGIGANMFLRGLSSLNASNQPLVVVDGMLFDMNDYGGSQIGNYFANPLANIDIKDIDNITFIKDAASVYGAKGANGVLIINTAQAPELMTRIDFAAYGGVNYAPRRIPVLGASEYRSYLSDMLKTRGLTDDQIQAQPYMNDDPANPQYYRYHNNTDWQDEVLKNSHTSNYYLKVTGGDNIAKYGLSLGYLDQDGTVAGTDFKRYSTRFNADYQMSPKLQATSNLGFTYNEHILKDEGLMAKTNPLYLALIKAPFLGVKEMSEEGIVSPNLEDRDIFNTGNPRTIIDNLNARNNNYRFFGSVGFNYDLNKGLKLNSLFGVTYDKLRENVFVPRRGVAPDTLASGIANSRMASQVQRLFSIYNDTYLSYNKVYRTIHGVSANLGVRYQNNRSEEDFALGFNSATDELQTVGTGSTALRRTGGDLGKWTWLNYYTNVDYSLQSKYFLSLAMALDGSSRFGKEAGQGLKLFDNAFGFFPSLGAGWLVSAENFMAGVPAIELLKLRASYGLTGNDDIGNYNARQVYVSGNLLGRQGIVRGNIGNLALQWETHQKLNVGVDMALLNERLTVSVDAYRNRTNNMLTFEPVLSVAGFDYAITNNGGMENTGVEVALNGRLLDKAVRWDLGLTFAKNRNELTKLPGNALISPFADASMISVVGQPAVQFYGYRTNGVYTSDEAAAAEGYSTRLFNGNMANFQGGDVRFVDQNNDKVINDEDRVVIGNPNPDFSGMFQNHLSWKGFSLDAAFTFSYGNDIYNYTRARLESMSGPENQTLRVRNRWITNGMLTDVPRAQWGDPMNNSRFSDRWIEDGSYLRLRSLSLAYNVPFKPGFFKSLNVYLTGNNLVTFTKYLGYDPEFSAGASPLMQGSDIGLAPQFKSVLLGFRLGL